MMLLASALVRAQQCDSINNHMAGWYCMNPSGIIQLDNGDLLCRCMMVDLDENGLAAMDENGFANILGYKYYWISNDGLSIVDSLLVQSDDKTEHLWTRLHQNENTPLQFLNLDAYIVSGEDNGKCLRITFFDDQLNYNAETVVTVPLDDTDIVLRDPGSWLLDGNNDIVLRYCVPSRRETRFIRVGLDGTVKSEKNFTESQMPFDDGRTWHPQGLSQYGYTSLGYNYFGRQQGNGIRVIAYELDPSFNVTNTFDLPDQWTVQSGHTYPHTQQNGSINGMVSLEDGSALIVRNTEWANGNKATGVVKYDKNGNVLKEAWFNPFNNNKESYCYSLTQDGWGDIFFSASCMGGNGRVDGVTVVKMDQDLNVIWEDNGMNGQWFRFIGKTEVFDSGDFAVVGFNDYYQQNFVRGMFLKLFPKEKGNNGVSETNHSLRPYAFFPNPVEEQLCLHFSPDVTPLQADLFDLSGRLVYTQNSDLENINMSQLPTGTYTLRVVMADGTSYSDKIVKQ